MFVKLVDGSPVITKIGDLEASHPNVSFPHPITNDMASEWGYFPLTTTEHPSHDPLVEELVEGTPVLVGDNWTQVWDVTPLSQTKAEAKVRAERNRLLSETDWRFRSDMSPTQDWIDYCQSLRDLTNQVGFPHDVNWPVTPAV